MPRRTLLLILLLLAAHAARGQVASFDERDAVVWSQQQLVEGSLAGAEAGALRLNGDPIPFRAEAGRFAVPVRLAAGTNVLVLCAGESCPDTLRLTLGYEPRPEIEARASVAGRSVRLHARVLADPDALPLAFAWTADPDNPAPVALSGASDTLASFTLPETAPAGEYYFDLVAASEADTARARTLVTADSTGGLRPFDPATDHAAWVDRAVIYGITPYNFHQEGNLRDVLARLPELAELGVNTLWLQPVFRTGFGGQGYDVTDYFRVRPDYGTEQDLRAVIAAAHARGMKVLLDFVPNHTSILHPYAQDAIRHGDSSHYFDFYQRERDDARYAMHYHTRTVGKMRFVYYFWEDLPNLNYDHPEVQRWMTEAARFWIERFDADGYRIDAVWAPRARNPAFLRAWRLVLKRLKPEALLLGEDKAADASAFEVFDAAYDWKNDDVWVSEWGWQPGGHDSPTIFNAPEHERAALLHASLTNGGRGWHPDARVLRFLENNDTPRFITQHDLARTRMAAALLFSVPGIPLIYNGQEVGRRGHPYETFSVFQRNPYIRSQYVTSLFPYYRQLARLRTSHPALHGGTFAAVPVQPAGEARHVYAYRRWAGGRQVLGVVNMGARPASVTLALAADEVAPEGSERLYLNDLLAGGAVAVGRAELAALAVEVPAYTTRLLELSDVSAGPVAVDEPGDGAPRRFALEQNYPNPFNPATAIAFELPAAGRARLAVHDLLGREVAVLVDEPLPAGRHEARFDGAGLASGVYFYRLRAAGRTETRRMLLVR